MATTEAPAGDAADAAGAAGADRADHTTAHEVEGTIDGPPGHVDHVGHVDHKVIGQAQVLLGFVFLLAGGVVALVMRTQLLAPEADVVTQANYSRLLTLHGTYTVFLFLLPVWLGLATAVVPLQIGSDRLAYPRLAALSLWLFVAGGVFAVCAPLAQGGVRAGGWTLQGLLVARDDLPGRGPDLLMLGLGLVALAAIVGALNLVATLLLMRAPGMTAGRLPLFSYSVLVMGAVLLLALPVLVAGLALLFVGRHYGGQAFVASRGGNPLLWGRMFWFAAYPTLWAMTLPAFGVLGEVVPVLTRSRLAAHEMGHKVATGGLVAIGALAFVGWGSELPLDDGLPRWFFGAGALVILAPAALLVLVSLSSLRLGRPRIVSPLLWCIGFASTVLLGAAGAAIMAFAPGSRRVGHGSYWATGVHHYLFFGAAVFGVVAALVWWLPKLRGGRLPEGLGVVGFLAVFGGAHLTFLAFYVLGLQKMPQGVSAYDGDERWQGANVVATLGGYLLALGLVAVVLGLLVVAVRRRRSEGVADPWEGHTLEWSTPSPPPAHNFDALPEVRSERPLLDIGARRESETAEVGA